MKRTIKLTESDLTNLVKQVIKEDDSMVRIEGGQEYLSMQLNKIEKGLRELKNVVDNDDKETATHIIQMLIHNIKLIGV